MQWETAKLGEVCNIIGGGTPSKSNDSFYEGIIPWATVRDMRKEVLSSTELCITEEAIKSSSTNLIPSGAIIIATRVGLGKVCILNQDTAINQDLKAIIPNDEKLDNTFLYWWLKSIAHVIVAAGTGATVQGVKLTFVKSLEIVLPPIPEQKRIVTLLDTIFADLEQARAKTEQNLKNARELFDSYLQQVFNQRGEGWVELKMSDVCEGKITDGTHQTPKYFDEGFIFLSSKNVTSGKIDWDNVKYLDEAQHIEMQKRLSPRLNDILLAKNGTTGVADIVDRDVVFDIYVSLALLRPSEKVEPRYLLHYVNSPIAKKQFNLKLKGIGVPNLHLKEIKEVKIAFPSCRHRQKEIVGKIEKLLQLRIELEKVYSQKLNAIDELKKSILQKAFSGELTATTS